MTQADFSREEKVSPGIVRVRLDGRSGVYLYDGALLERIARPGALTDSAGK